MLVAGSPDSRRVTPNRLGSWKALDTRCLRPIGSIASHLHSLKVYITKPAGFRNIFPRKRETIRQRNGRQRRKNEQKNQSFSSPISAFQARRILHTFGIEFTYAFSVSALRPPSGLRAARGALGSAAIIPNLKFLNLIYAAFELERQLIDKSLIPVLVAFPIPIDTQSSLATSYAAFVRSGY